MAMPRRAVVNFVLEGVTLLILALVIATGFVMEFQLPPGHGRGGARAMLGMTRHEWGDIHFWLSIAFIVLMAAHLWLHWRWIWALAKGRGANQGTRGAAFLAVSALFVLLMVSPWLLPVTTAPEGERERRGGERGAVAGDERPEPAGQAGAVGEEAGEETLRGGMTLAEAAEVTGLSVAQIGTALGLPGEVDPAAKLGQSARAQGLDMNQARQKIQAAMAAAKK